MGVPVNIPNDDNRLAMAGIDNPATDLNSPHWYSGITTALPDSLTQGFAETVSTLDKAVIASSRTGMKWGAMLASPDPTGPERPDYDSMVDQLGGQNSYLQAFEDSKKSMDALRGWSQQQLAPDKVATLPAFAGNIAKGLEVYGMGSLFGGPAAGAATLGATTANTTYEDNPDLDPATRLKLAATSGITAGAGAFLPGGVGGSLVKRIISGAAINAGFQVGGRYASSSILEHAGYPDMAKQYAPLDAKSVAADAILGAAFGALHAPGERPDQATIEQALDDRRTATISRGAGGLPASPEAINADAKLQNEALAALIKGENPNISPEDLETVLKESVLDPEKVDWHQQVLDASAKEYGLLVDPTPPEIQEGPVGLRARIEAEGEAAVSEPGAALTRYAEDPRTVGGKIISGDLMAEAVSPSVAEHPIEGHGIIAEHGAANRLANDLYESRMAEPAQPGESVLIMVGNAGAGKSTIAKFNAPNYHTILDTNGADPQGLQQSVNLALKSGRQVDVLLAHTPLEEAVDRNIRRQATEGRAVRILDQADLAVKAPASFGQAMEVFGHDPNVSFSVKETTPNGLGHVGPEAQDFVQKLREENANRNNLDTAVRAYTQAKGGADVSPEARAAFEHGLQEAGVSPEALSGRVRTGASGDREAGRAAPNSPSQSAALDPLIKEQAAQLAHAHPDMPVDLPDGRTVPAAALETELANSLKQAERDSGLFDTAISCFLRSTL